MRFSPSSLLKRLKRDQVNDPFGGDDGEFDDGEGFSLSGPKIALALSGLLFVLLIGGVATVILTAEPPETAAPMMGSLADLEVVEEEEEVAPPPPETPSNVVAATDRSAERRPWLNPTTAADGEAARPGMAQTPADQQSATPQAAPQTADAAPAPSAQPAAQAQEPPARAETTPDVAKNEPEPAQTQQTAAAETAPVPVQDAPAPEPERQPSLADAGPAPGAPGLFGVNGDGAANTAGARPRLVEPELPPIDRRAVAAPPPRYANLATVRSDAGPADTNTGTSKVAFVVSGLGLSATATEAAITKLPASVTLAFSPYTRDLKKWLDMAKEHGHEVLIEVPMESKQFPAEDPGPLGLLTSLDEKERQTRLETILKEAEGAVGVLDTMGSQYRESDEHISAVFAKLREENLYYVQGQPGVRVGEATIPTAMADVVLDERPFRAAIDARLDYAERLAKYQGSVVAALSAKPVSFERLVLWMEQAKGKGIVLAPVSQLLIQ